jgi:hypothetical protein
MSHIPALFTTVHVSGILILLILQTGILLAQTPELENGCGGNMRLFNDFSLYYRQSTTPEQRKEERERLERSISNNSFERYKVLMDVYEKKKVEIKIGNAAVYVGEKFFTLTSDLIFDGLDKIGITKNPMTNLAAKVSNVIVDEAITAGAAAIYEKQAENRQKILDGLLFNLRDQNEQAYHALLQEPATTEEQLINQLFAANINNNGFYQSLEAEDRTLFQKHMLEELQEKVRTAQLQGLGRDQAMAARIEDNTKMLFKVEQEFEQFVTTTTQRIQQMHQAQGQIQQKISVLSRRADLNTRDLDFIKSFLYDKMNPREKLDFIDRGYLDHLSAVDREKEIQKLELLEAQEAFLHGAKGYLSDAQHIVTIAKNLGIEGRLLERAQQGVNLLNSGLNVFQQFSGGNYLGAVASLTGIFGGRGTDPTLARLINLDKSMNNILASQRYMITQLNSIQAGINELVRGQEVLYQTLIQVEHTVTDQYNRLQTGIQQLHRDVLYNRKQLHYYASEQRIFSVRNQLQQNTNDVQFDIEHGTVPNYYAFRSHLYHSLKSGLAGYERDLTDVFTVLQDQRLAELERTNRLFSLPQHFKVTEFNSTTDSLRDYNKQSVYNYLDCKFLLQRHLSEVSEDKANSLIVSLYFPTLSTEQLKSKHNIEGRPIGTPDSKITRYLNYMKAECSPRIHVESPENNNLLEPRYLIEASYTALNFFTLYYYLDYRLDLLSEADAKRGANIAGEKTELLSDAQFLLNIAVAQQNLLAGDIIIPYMYSVMSKGIVYPAASDTTDRSAVRRVCLRLLERNELLRYNFFKYYFTQRIKERKRGLSNYSLGLSYPNTSFMHNILHTSDSLPANDSSTVQQLKMVYKVNPAAPDVRMLCYEWINPEGQIFSFPFPSASSNLDMEQLDEMRNQQFYHNNAIGALLKVKEGIERELLHVQFLSEQPQAERQAFYQMALLGTLTN